MNDNLNKKEFFDWIKGILFEQKDMNPPLFGDFSWPDDHFINDGNISSCFSEAQVLLIHCLASLDFPCIILPVSLYLILSWYRSQRNYTFMQVFPDDEIYWDTMIGILVEKFSNTSESFSVSTFVASLSV
jgi:hypothetical protein